MRYDNLATPRGYSQRAPLLEVGRGEQEPGAPALVQPRRSDIRDGELPGIDYLTVKAAVGPAAGNSRTTGPLRRSVKALI